MIVCYFVSSTAHKSPQIKPSTLFMQARVDWVLNIFGTQVTKENRPVRPVSPDYLSVSYDCGLPLYFETFKVGFSLSKKVTFVSFHENPKRTFPSWDIYIFVLTFWLCRNGLIRKLLLLKFVTSQTGQQIITIQMLFNISRNIGSQTMKSGQIIEYNMRNAKLEHEKLVPDLFMNN